MNGGKLVNVLHNFSVEYFDFLLQSDSGMKLLKSRSAKAVISFLYGAFRREHLQTILSDELESKLASFLNMHGADEKEIEEDALQDSTEKHISAFAEAHTRARIYINYWCSENRSYLRRYQTAEGEIVVELSAGVERLFNYLEDAGAKDFIGTESRFKNILEQLTELKDHVNADPEERIKQLEAQKKKIDDEINEIKRTGKTEIYSPLQVTERLNDISRRSRDLLSDFRQVEDNFRKIMKDIYRAQSQTDTSRGQILGYTLDTSRKLRESPQGQTFTSFWNFISQDKDDKISSLMHGILDTTQMNWADDFMLNLKKYLYQAGHKVVEQNRTLSERINKMLSNQNISEHKRIDTLISEVKAQMLNYTKAIEEGAKEANSDFMEVDTKCGIYFPQARYAVYPEAKNKMAEMTEFSSASLDISSFSGLFNQFYIDDKVLKANVADFKKKKESFTLSELFSEYPIQKGLSEIIAYLDLVKKECKTQTCNDEKEIIQFTKNDNTVSVTVPRMIFS